MEPTEGEQGAWEHLVYDTWDCTSDVMLGVSRARELLRPSPLLSLRVLL